MTRSRRRIIPDPKKRRHGITLLEQKPSLKNALITGVSSGLEYGTIAKHIGVCTETMSGWLRKAGQVQDQFQKMGLSEEEIDEISQSIPELNKVRGELVEKYGQGVVTVIEQEGFWLELIYSLKKADAEAEGRMLGVIRGAAIGGHEVVEEKRRSVVVKDPDGGERMLNGEEVTRITKQIRPQWQAAAWFLERKYPEKYAQRKIIEGDLPKDVPYEVYMTAKTLLQLPKVELDRIVGVLREKRRPRLVEDTRRTPSAQVVGE